jgi:hypothetical protein
MGKVHHLIESRGKQDALREVDFPRAEVEAAAQFMACDGDDVGFLYSGWCQAALPHRRLVDDKGWQVTSDFVTLVVQPGMIPGSDGSPKPIGVPYGSRARLIMLYLQSEALRTQNRQVALGRSMRHWLEKLGVPWGGKSIEAIRDQAMRISYCRLSFSGRMVGNHGDKLEHQQIVEEAILLDSSSYSGQASLFPEVALLSQKFFDKLQKHSVPLQEAAIRAISNNSLSLDLYAWLAYRLHHLKAPCDISWPALKGQFGLGFSDMKNFRPRFTENLRLAMAVYPDAKVDVGAWGATLYPSPPPVRPRIVAQGRAAKVPTPQQQALLA